MFVLMSSFRRKVHLHKRFELIGHFIWWTKYVWKTEFKRSNTLNLFNRNSYAFQETSFRSLFSQRQNRIRNIFFSDKEKSRSRDKISLKFGVEILISYWSVIIKLIQNILKKITSSLNSFCFFKLSHIINSYNYNFGNITFKVKTTNFEKALLIVQFLTQMIIFLNYSFQWLPAFTKNKIWSNKSKKWNQKIVKECSRNSKLKYLMTKQMANSRNQEAGTLNNEAQINLLAR